MRLFPLFAKGLFFDASGTFHCQSKRRLVWNLVESVAVELRTSSTAASEDLCQTRVQIRVPDADPVM